LPATVAPGKTAPERFVVRIRARRRVTHEKRWDRLRPAGSPDGHAAAERAVTENANLNSKARFLKRLRAEAGEIPK
jgi:hypothetical protein